MLIIRLTRRGRRNDPSFRLVVTEHTNPVRGKFLEELGFYNPKLKSKSFKQERILYWISKGAKLSPTVNNLLISSGVIQGEKVKAWRPKKREGGATEALKTDVKAEKAPEAQAPVAEEKASEAEPAPVEENKEPTVELVKEEKKEEKAPEAEEKQESQA